MPQVPTVAEAGLPNFELESWVALYVPSGTPKDVVQKLSADVKRSLELAETKQRADAAGVEVRYLTPDNTTKLLERDTASWAKAIKSANIKFDWQAQKQKSHPKVAKLLIDMVGDTWIEHVTPAVWRLKHFTIFLFKINKLAHHDEAKVV